MHNRGKNCYEEHNLTVALVATEQKMTYDTEHIRRTWSCILTFTTTFQFLHSIQEDKVCERVFFILRRFKYGQVKLQTTNSPSLPLFNTDYYIKELLFLDCPHRDTADFSNYIHPTYFHFWKKESFPFWKYKEIRIHYTSRNTPVHNSLRIQERTLLFFVSIEQNFVTLTHSKLDQRKETVDNNSGTGLFLNAGTLDRCHQL